MKGGGEYHVWRTFEQVWALHLELGAAFPGFEPHTMKLASGHDVRYKLAQTFVSSLLSHALLAKSPPVQAFLAQGAEDTNLHRVLQICSVSEECDLASRQVGIIWPGAVVVAAAGLRGGGRGGDEQRREFGAGGGRGFAGGGGGGGPRFWA